MEVLGRSYAWLGTDTQQSLLDAGQFVAALEPRQETPIACFDEIAYRMNHIDAEQLLRLSQNHGKSQYGKYLLRVQEEPGET